jgi:hypothetical protein
MKSELFYTILRFKGGLILGESLNAGILFFNPQTAQFTFEEGDLSRIAGAYPNLNVTLLKRYTSTLRRNLKKYGEGPNAQISLVYLESFISKELFFSDAAGLTFDSLERLPLSNNSNFQQTAAYLKQLFLVGFREKATEKKKHNEEYILWEVYKILKAEDHLFQAKIKRNETVEAPLVRFTFDIKWEGLKIHLVKAVSLDLDHSSLIQNKALQLYGAFEQLRPQLFNDYGNPEIDLLLVKPQIKSNFSEFDKAVKILETTQVPLQIHSEIEWKNYVNNLVKNASLITQD